MTKLFGVFICFLIGLAAWAVGGFFPILGAPLIAIMVGMVVGGWLPQRKDIQDGIGLASKKGLQAAIVLLGFGLNLGLVLETGRQGGLAILGAIFAGLVTAYLVQHIVKLPGKTPLLIGVGSAICGGSAIAAAAPAAGASEEEVATALSVTVFFNILAAFLFPYLGRALNLDYEGFGILAGAAINDTSSVTAAAAIWDQHFNLGTAALDVAVTIKLIRTLAIIPITLGIAYRNKGSQNQKAFPTFILYFLGAVLITTFLPLPAALISGLRTASRFLILTAMAAIGLKTNLPRLLKTSPRPLFLGFCCSLVILLTTLVIIL